MRVYEEMRRFRVGPYTIRLWIESSDADDPNVVEEDARRVAVELVVSITNTPRRTAEIAKAIADSVDFLNAVEVLDENGDGSLVYPSWP